MARSTLTSTRAPGSSSSRPATSTSADLTVTVDYETAKAILVEGNAQAAMQAFMAGRIKIEVT